jgi:predicted permease
MLDTIGTTLIPVAFVILLGYFAGRLGFFGSSGRTVLTQLVLTWLLPPLLLSAIAKTPQVDLLDCRVLLLLLVAMMGPFLAILLVCRFGPGLRAARGGGWRFHSEPRGALQSVDCRGQPDHRHRLVRASSTTSSVRPLSTALTM